jgi:hypothetical protein
MITNPSGKNWCSWFRGCHLRLLLHIRTTSAHQRRVDKSINKSSMEEGKVAPVQQRNTNVCTIKLEGEFLEYRFETSTDNISK